MRHYMMKHQSHDSHPMLKAAKPATTLLYVEKCHNRNTMIRLLVLQLKIGLRAAEKWDHGIEAFPNL